ncbi:MAG: MmgE/PrpD family protein [Betaproteobacteria bacterium]|nr:MmgE/PrpD family protein [Betaproteobacteria bacterium]
MFLVTTPGNRFTEYLTSLAERDLTDQLTQYATMALLDNVACGLYGARQPWSKMMIDLVKSEQSRGRATLYGEVGTIAPVHAALANGTAIHGFELDDVFLGALSHPGAVVFPAALATAETHGGSGARFLLALVAGYETMWRVARALNTAHNHRGFHTTAVAGPIASTVAAGIVMGFDAQQLNSAIGIAASSAGGLKAFTQGTGGMVKRMHPGRASEAGVLACELASRGFSGPQQAIDGRYGLLQVFEGESARPRALDEYLGKSFAITHVHLKVWPCCSLLHSAVQALEALKQEHGLLPPQIKRIRLNTSARVIAQNGDSDPRESMAAQYSLPFCAGAALARDAQDPVTFEPQSLGDENVRMLMKCVELVEDEEINAQYPDHVGSKAEITLASGRVVSAAVLDPHGTPADPCSVDEIEARFRRLTATVKTPDAANRIIAAARRLTKAPSLDEFSKTLREGNLSCS